MCGLFLPNNIRTIQKGVLDIVLKLQTSNVDLLTTMQPKNSVFSMNSILDLVANLKKIPNGTIMNSKLNQCNVNLIWNVEMENAWKETSYVMENWIVAKQMTTLMKQIVQSNLMSKLDWLVGLPKGTWSMSSLHKCKQTAVLFP